MSVGLNIKQRRHELRMSQQELADAMGYKTRSTIAKIESGENDVSQNKLLKFATVLDTTVEQLMFGYVITPIVSGSVPSFSALSKNKNIAVILAGGNAERNQENVPSQFINVHGKPIIVYSMEAYQAHPAIDDIFVVCMKGWENIVNAYAVKYGIAKLRRLISAGNTGITSLKNAVEHIKDSYSLDDLIIIQESTRPLVTVETISKLLHACSDKGSATICYSMKEYVQFNISGGKAEYVDRNKMIALQSPEAHRLSLLIEVFEKSEKIHHPLQESCCTMLMYNLGYDINFIESSVNNIKIARSEDIATVSAII